MWAGLKKKTRDGAEPQGWQRWATVSSLSLKGHGVEAVTGTQRQSCAVEEEPETGTMNGKEAATAPKRTTSIHSPSFFISSWCHPLGNSSQGRSWEPGSPGDAIHIGQPPRARCKEAEGREWIWRSKQKIFSTLTYGKH